MMSRKERFYVVREEKPRAFAQSEQNVNKVLVEIERIFKESCRKMPLKRNKRY